VFSSPGNPERLLVVEDARFPLPDVHGTFVATGTAGASVEVENRDMTGSFPVRAGFGFLSRGAARDFTVFVFFEVSRTDVRRLSRFPGFRAYRGRVVPRAFFR
jgi:hypothetical protein